MKAEDTLIHYCESCEEKTQHRWLTDEDGEWEPDEKPILICCECGEELCEN